MSIFFYYAVWFYPLWNCRTECRINFPTGTLNYILPYISQDFEMSHTDPHIHNTSSRNIHVSGTTIQSPLPRTPPSVLFCTTVVAFCVSIHRTVRTSVGCKRPEAEDWRLKFGDQNRERYKESGQCCYWVDSPSISIVLYSWRWWTSPDLDRPLMVSLDQHQETPKNPNN